MRLEVQTRKPQHLMVGSDLLLDEPISEIEDILERGIAHANNGRKSEARKDLLRVTEKDPHNEDAWMWLASISEYPEELLVFLQNVLRINPENERAIEWTQSTKALLAKTFVQRGIDSSNDDRKDFAKQCFLQAISNDDRNELAWMWLASVTENLEEKALHLNKAISINPENETAREALASVNKLLGIPEEAESDTASEKSKLDLALMEESEEELCCPFCEKPKFFDTIVCTSCDALQSLDDIDALFAHDSANHEVVENAIQKLEGEKSSRELTALELINLGLACFNVKKFERGVSVLEEALAKEPGNFPLETSLALIKSRLNDEVEAANESASSISANVTAKAPESEVVNETDTDSSVEFVADSPDENQASTEVSNENDEAKVQETDSENLTASELETAGLNVENTEVASEVEASPENEISQEDESNNNAATPAKEVATEGDLVRTIMIVDESPTVRKLVTKKLEDSGFTVLAVDHGTEALAILDGVTPDLVLLDVAMPHLDGYEVCKLIREIDTMKFIPVILISEKGSFYDDDKGNAAGASGHLLKPFGPGALMRTIEGFLS